ncbi:hypothetical protein C5167_041194 [Papaver somniferum]|uniref:Peptidase A1 domain-containing protein n=1 Tax=Papaver somniferum TaxID=3469 RepID=A0A4Y7IKK5_PAPSO|nr:aspartic proteinase CDR1-like [Papaver somniferum]RZC48261.1 hypothetical protein C5167_041194 [Papaver somniferum]
MGTSSSSSSSISSSALLLLIFLILVSSSSCFISATSFSFSDHKRNTKPVGFTARLIHRDSPESPFYDPKLTDAERMRNAEERSMERYNHFTRRPNDVRAPVDYRTSAFVIIFGVGTPPVDTYALIDTASDMTWIQCRPCEQCYTQDKGVPIFDPRKSSSYVKIGCEDPLCNGEYPGQLTCDRDGIFCSYHQSYYDAAQSEGILSIDNFSFLDDTHFDGTKIKIQLPFGCGHNNTYPNGDYGIPGVFGVNKDALSFISLNNIDRFSHCFASIYRKGSPKTSLIRFGEDAIITNETTPMVGFGNKSFPLYYVSLEGISVGLTRLNIPQGTFQISETGYRGVIIDTGTTNTNLAGDAYDVLLAELEKRIILERVSISNYELCYLVETMEQVINDFPKITYHFTGLNHTLDVWNAWSLYSGKYGLTVCLRFKRATDDLTIIGFQHLLDVNVGYDLRNKVISLQNGDCTKE